MPKTTEFSDLVTIQLINPLSLYNPTNNAYSHIAIVQDFTRIIHISGQGAENSHGSLPHDFEQQVLHTFDNIKHALIAAHAELKHIAVLRILIVEHNEEKHKILINYMQKLWNNTAFPACTLIPVHCLALPNMQIEIEVTAYC